MKAKNIFKRSFFVAAVMTAGLVAVLSCKKEDSNSGIVNNGNTKTYTIAGSATGSQENPAVVTSGTASLSGTYNAASNKMEYTITWADLSGSATAVQLSGPGAMGVNAGVLAALNITTNGINGTSSGTLTLADSDETNLINGNVYYTILTVANPMGEVRGQVSAIANK